MSGYEVCERLKADKKTRDIPIIFISALDATGDKIKAFTVGGLDYITKPFQFEEVLARVETHLSLRKLQKQLQDANKRFEQELALAGRVQASFLPKELPDISGWQLAVTLKPARETSGDFYDINLLANGELGDPGCRRGWQRSRSGIVYGLELDPHPHLRRRTSYTT